MVGVLDGISIAANVIQLADFTTKVLKRLEEYRETVTGLPKSLDHVRRRLSLLSNALDSTEKAIVSGAIAERSKDVLREAMEGCTMHIEELTVVLDKALPPPGASKAQVTWKALKSLRYDGKIEKINSQLGDYIRDLTFHAASTTFVPPTERPSQPPPSSTVMFRKHPNYVDRPSIMSQIEVKCMEPAARVALVGIGGAGKSQLAIEYAYRLRSSSPMKWVFWISADSEENFENGFAQIAQKAKIGEWNPRDKNRLNVVSSWLADENNGSWLIILDNADDLGVLLLQASPQKNDKLVGASGTSISGKPSRDLLALLPQTANGAYLVTSRHREAAYRIVGDYKSIIEVKEMDENEAVHLLEKILVEPVSLELSTKLVKALGYVPLAVTHAAACINQKAPRMTVERFIEEIDKGDEDRQQLLELDVYDPRRDGHRSNSAIITWHISFEQIRQSRPSAARLLSLMSLFNPQGIPERLLKDRYTSDVTNHQAWWKRLYALGRNGNATPTQLTSHDFEEDWLVLTNYSLITTDVLGDHFSMHGLVQYSTKRWLELHGELENWKRNYIYLINEFYPHCKPWEHQELCGSLLPHATAALACEPPDMVTMAIWAMVIYKIGEYFYDLGSFDGAEYMYQNAWRVFIKASGVKNPNALETARNLAVVLESQCKYSEAEAVLQHLYKIQKKILGSEHKESVEIERRLQEVLLRVGKDDEAKVLYEKSLRRSTRGSGPTQKETLLVMRERALTLFRQGREEEGLKICMHVFEMRQQVLGKSYDELGVGDLSYMSLGLMMTDDQSHLARAETTLRYVLGHCESTLGVDHQVTTPIARHLGSALERQEKYHEAEEMYRRASYWYRKRDGGLKSEDSWASTAELVRVLSRTGEIEEREVLCEDLFNNVEKVYGGNTLELAEVNYFLANMRYEQGCIEDALSLYEKAYTLNRELAGEGHVDTGDIYNDLQKCRGRVLEIAA